MCREGTARGPRNHKPLLVIQGGGGAAGGEASQAAKGKLEGGWVTQSTADSDGK